MTLAYLSLEQSLPSMAVSIIPGRTPAFSIGLFFIAGLKRSSTVLSPPGPGCIATPSRPAGTWASISFASFLRFF